MRLLIVEDDPDIAEFVQKVLKEENHAVDITSDGEQGEYLALTEPYDLIILDIMLPKLNGQQLLRNLRTRKNDTPVLILSARGEVPDRVAGLEGGADDYLVKPFAVAELRARVHSLLRRKMSEKSPVLSVGNLFLNPETQEVHFKDQKIILPGREYAILEFLLRNKNRLVSKSMIAEHVWDYHFDSDYNLIEVYIRNLRRKIESEGKIIQTVRNGGYIIRDTQE